MTRFFRERWIELLIAGVWLQSVISALFTGNLALLAITTLGGLALLALIFWIVSKVQKRSLSLEYGHGEAFDVPRQAVIFSVGRQVQTACLALREQRPQWVGLLCSRITETTAESIHGESGLDAEHVQKEIVDPWNVEELRVKLTFILDWLDRQCVPREEIVIDITGGTSIMSAAAFSIAVEQHIDCQCVRSDYDENNHPISGTQRGVFVMHHHDVKTD
jgi:hypothetical protein